MTSTTDFRIEQLELDAESIRRWGPLDPKHSDWPVVYVLSNSDEVYVGESINAESRLLQHTLSPSKEGLDCVRVVVDDRFNKSVCLDLESYLIQLFSGDGERQVRNGNAGIVNADYYDRPLYREMFNDIFEQLRRDFGLFTQSLEEIRNSDLFKLSPFKALNEGQMAAVQGITEGLFEDLIKQRKSLRIVDGAPGTGKTIVAIFLLKLLGDIAKYDPDDVDDLDTDIETMARVLFTPDNARLLQNVRIGIVVPQQSLRKSMKRVFAITPGLSPEMVLTPFEVGESSEKYDILVVDEAHRLNHRANQPSASQNKRFAEINMNLFGADSPEYTQLDWLKEQSQHVLLMLDPLQTVRPADLPLRTTHALISVAKSEKKLHSLESQMRISTGENYVGYVRDILSDSPPRKAKDFGDYDLRMFDSVNDMHAEIMRREAESGLSRMVAGYAWEWRSRRDKQAFDIEFDGFRKRWNSTQVDWINSPVSADEVGSIHTVQGYDLNYAGVIIGSDLRYDPDSDQLVFDRSQYYDKKGMENNLRRGIRYTDTELLEYISNIYTVLMTRGILGTYVYVCDQPLREYLRKYIPSTNMS